MRDTKDGDRKKKSRVCGIRKGRSPGNMYDKGREFGEGGDETRLETPSRRGGDGFLRGADLRQK